MQNQFYQISMIDFRPEISPLDELYGGNINPSSDPETVAHHISQYIRCGREMANYARLMSPRAKSILELPCGFGRVTRHLIALFPHAKLQCVDVLPEAIRYQKDYLSTDAILIDPPALRYPVLGDGHFDLVIVGALMTHLDEANSAIFLDEMRRKTQIGGRIVTTVRGDDAYKKFRDAPIYQTTEDDRQRMLNDYMACGFAFAPYARHHTFEAETSKVAGDGYGIALTSPLWMEKLAAELDLRLIDHQTGGWDNHLDFFTFERVL